MSLTWFLIFLVLLALAGVLLAVVLGSPTRRTPPRPRRKVWTSDRLYKVGMVLSDLLDAPLRFVAFIVFLLLFAALFSSFCGP